MLTEALGASAAMWHRATSACLRPSCPPRHHACTALLQDLSFRLAPDSLWVLDKQHPARKACILLVHWRAFEAFILLTVLANCVTLSLDSNRPGFDTTSLGQGLKLSNYCFIAIFAAEALFKIIALGFILEPNTYLRDGACVCRRRPQRRAAGAARRPVSSW